MQINTALPLEKLKEIEILESSEQLEDIKENENIILLKDHEFLIPKLRKNAVERLKLASGYLPLGHKLLVVTAFRPVGMQKRLWRNRLIQMAKAHPFMMMFQHRKWKKEVSKFTSPPGGSSHQYGGAVDVTVLDQNNNRLDMGTSLTDFGEKVKTHTNLISEEQKINRKILFDAMTKAGFVNYPNEWWHYSYGDRMWAAYSQEKSCIYGPLTIS